MNYDTFCRIVNSDFINKVAIFFIIYILLHSYPLTRLLMLASQNKSNIGVFNLGTVFFFLLLSFFYVRVSNSSRWDL